jgi:hypothetical protein
MVRKALAAVAPGHRDHDLVGIWQEYNSDEFGILCRCGEHFRVDARQVFDWPHELGEPSAVEAAPAYKPRRGPRVFCQGDE